MRIKIPGSEKLDQKIKTILALETITYKCLFWLQQRIVDIEGLVEGAT